MDREDARSVVKELVANLADHHREMAVLRERLDELADEAAGLSKLVRAYFDVYPSLEDEFALELLDRTIVDSGDEPPRGAVAVRAVLHDHPGDSLLVSEILESLRRRGWLPDSDNPANAVRAALERLVASGEEDVYKNARQRGPGSGKIQYGFHPDGPPPQERNFDATEEPF